MTNFMHKKNDVNCARLARGIDNLHTLVELVYIIPLHAGVGASGGSRA